LSTNKNQNELEKSIIEKLLGIEDFKEIQVRVDDTDLMSVVHANRYLTYFDDAFINFLSKLNKNAGNLSRKGIVFPVRKIEIDYNKSATFGDTVLVHTRVIKVGNTSLTLAMDCYRNTKSKDTHLAKGVIVRLIMDMNNDNKLIKITDFFSEIVKI